MENPNQFRENQFTNNPQFSLPNSTAVLVLGIISIIGCFCYGIPGIICGIIALVLYGKDKKLYDQSPSSYTASSFSNLKSGRICAIVGLALSAVYAVVVIVWLIIFGAAILSNPQDIFRNM